jgi:hypothetical protein
MVTISGKRLLFSTEGKAWRGKIMQFAQSPQVLIMGNKLRIYFSTRESNDEKFLSHVAYAEFDEKFKLLNFTDSEVLSLGSLGTYDEHGIFPLNVVRFKERIFGYVGGWNRRKSVQIDGAIGISESFDNGKTFVRIADGPIIDSSLSEPFLIGDPFVIHVNGTFHMWYIYGKEWIKDPITESFERIYKITHAISVNGIDWTKDSLNSQLISDSIGPNEAQAMPTVIKINDAYYLFYCFREVFDFRENPKNTYRIGCSVSSDLRNWQSEEIEFEQQGHEEDWDSEMRCYPHAFTWKGKNYLAYNGNRFGEEGFGLAEILPSVR